MQSCPVDGSIFMDDSTNEGRTQKQEGRMKKSKRNDTRYKGQKRHIPQFVKDAFKDFELIQVGMAGKEQGKHGDFFSQLYDAVKAAKAQKQEE